MQRIERCGELFLVCLTFNLSFFFTPYPQAVEDKSTLSGWGTSIGLDSNMLRFLFYRQDTGVNISTLMSVAYQNWYVSTQPGNNKPLTMCLQSTSHAQIFNIREEVEY